ncbi:MAG: hypothetical protein AAGI38_02250 [Bacteroidota bacterium]
MKYSSHILVFLLATFLIWAGCNNNDDDGGIPIDNGGVVIDDSNSVRYTFEGITQTDLNGRVIFNDPTDWRLDDQWEDWEEGLFPEGSATLCDSGENVFLIGYPNPGDNITISIVRNSGTQMSFRIVDEFLSPLFSRDSAEFDAFTFSSALFRRQDTLRLYYKVFQDGCELRGHGDLLFE